MTALAIFGERFDPETAALALRVVREAIAPMDMPDTLADVVAADIAWSLLEDGCYRTTCGQLVCQPMLYPGRKTRIF